MKIYTKTGDEGQTSLLGGRRVSKSDLRIEAIGAVDELNASLGVVRSLLEDRGVDATLERVQHELFAIGAELANPEPAKSRTPVIGLPEIEQLESTIDRLEAELPPLTQFILPGGGPAGATVHLARTICRRAERCVVTLRQDDSHLASHVVVYLNRLSDLLFVMARAVNRAAGREEQPWVPAR
ncbi:MAG: cob(I)yrinic acid a,c-diamide adenosyltransferase [Pirellulales bacterium]